jgi:hypothetical protein
MGSRRSPAGHVSENRFRDFKLTRACYVGGCEGTCTENSSFSIGKGGV